MSEFKSLLYHIPSGMVTLTRLGYGQPLANQLAADLVTHIIDISSNNGLFTPALLVYSTNYPEPNEVVIAAQDNFMNRLPNATMWVIEAYTHFCQNLHVVHSNNPAIFNENVFALANLG